MSVHDDLVQLLDGPRVRALFSEVVEDEKRGVLHLLEEAVVGDPAVGAEGAAQVVEQVRDGGEEHLPAPGHLLDRDRHRQVGLAHARVSIESQPAFGIG